MRTLSRRRPRPRDHTLARLLLRIDAGLHDALKAAAREAGLSLNEYLARTLAARGSGFGTDPDAARVVAEAARLLGSDLIGVVAYGSWTRGEAASDSDVDVLVVVDRHVELTRDLYRRWDASGVRWSGRPVDAHFIHLPVPDAQPTGVWAEAAIDGIVLFERGLQISEHLIRVRRAIAAGTFVRRIVHGQPYWTGAS